MGKFYGKDQWNPKRIIGQIIVMQLLYYMGYGALVAAGGFVFGSDLDVDMFLSAHSIHFSSVPGWVTSIATVAAGAIGSFSLMFVVERAKKCLDFGGTVYFYHLIFTSIYSGFPVHWEWWVTHIVALVVMVVLGEYLCMRRELQDIPISDVLTQRSMIDFSGVGDNSRGARRDSSARYKKDTPDRRSSMHVNHTLGDRTGSFMESDSLHSLDGRLSWQAGTGAGAGAATATSLVSNGANGDHTPAHHVVYGAESASATKHYRSGSGGSAGGGLFPVRTLSSADIGDVDLETGSDVEQAPLLSGAGAAGLGSATSMSFGSPGMVDL